MNNYENCQTEIKRIMRLAEIEDETKIEILSTIRENWKKEFKTATHNSKPLDELIDYYERHVQYAKNDVEKGWKRTNDNFILERHRECLRNYEDILEKLKGLRDL